MVQTLKICEVVYHTVYDYCMFVEFKWSCLLLYFIPLMASSIVEWRMLLNWTSFFTVNIFICSEPKNLKYSLLYYYSKKREKEKVFVLVHIFVCVYMCVFGYFISKMLNPQIENELKTIWNSLQSVAFWIFSTGIKIH